MSELKSTNARLAEIRRRLAPEEQQDREALRAALEQRVDEWRGILRDHPAQARQVLHHLIGPITISMELAGVMLEPPMEGYDAADRRGHEGITAADYREQGAMLRWSAITTPAGLLAGLSGSKRMASPTGWMSLLRREYALVLPAA